GDVAEQVIDDEGRPQDGFDDGPHMGPESVGMLPVVDKGSDESQTVDSASAPHDGRGLRRARHAVLPRLDATSLSSRPARMARRSVWPSALFTKRLKALRVALGNPIWITCSNVSAPQRAMASAVGTTTRPNRSRGAHLALSGNSWRRLDSPAGSNLVDRWGQLHDAWDWRRFRTGTPGTYEGAERSDDDSPDMAGLGQDRAGSGL